MPPNLQKADRKSKPFIPDLQILFLQNAGMEKHQRLQIARKRHFRTAKEAALSLGVPYGTYSGHEKGTRGIKENELAIYARRLHVPKAWLAFGEGELDDFTVTVMGKIGAGSSIMPEVEQVPAGGLYEIRTPFTVPRGAIAFEVDGDSMWPRYDPGDVIVCWRQGSNMEEVIGWEAAVRTTDGQRYLKRILEGAESGTFDLESHNAPPIRNVRIEWVAQVHAVIRADMWKKAGPKEQKAIGRRLAVAGLTNTGGL